MVNDRSIDFVMAAMNEHSFATFLFWNRTENIISRRPRIRTFGWQKGIETGLYIAAVREKGVVYKRVWRSSATASVKRCSHCARHRIVRHRINDVVRCRTTSCSAPARHGNLHVKVAGQHQTTHQSVVRCRAQCEHPFKSAYKLLRATANAQSRCRSILCIRCGRIYRHGVV